MQSPPSAVAPVSHRHQPTQQTAASMCEQNTPLHVSGPCRAAPLPPQHARIETRVDEEEPGLPQ